MSWTCKWLSNSHLRADRAEGRFSALAALARSRSSGGAAEPILNQRAPDKRCSEAGTCVRIRGGPRGSAEHFLLPARAERGESSPQKGEAE